MQLNKASKNKERVDGGEIYIRAVRIGARDQECREEVTNFASALF